MRPINKNLKFVELENLVFEKTDKNIQVVVDVKYLDNLSKITSIFEYSLRLRENGNWTIIDSE